MRDAGKRWLYHFSHCNMRLRHRYGIEMTPEEFHALGALFKQKKVPNIRKDYAGHEEGWVKLRETWICVSYSPSKGCIGTVMPSPPPAIFDEVDRQAKTRLPGEPAKVKPEKNKAEALELKSKAMALQLLKQALAAGKVPKWIRNIEGGDRLVPEAVAQQKLSPDQPSAETKMKDIGWFKGKIGQAAKLLKHDNPFEAMVLLDAVASLPRSFHPGQNPEEAERILARRMAEFRETANRTLALAAEGAS